MSNSNPTNSKDKPIKWVRDEQLENVMKFTADILSSVVQIVGMFIKRNENLAKENIKMNGITNIAENGIKRGRKVKVELNTNEYNNINHAKVEISPSKKK
ncbi:MAG: hypothetical protein K8L97_34195 [Anaerolineae bacterium]|nr:hypothetical protein [Anaerolineae bacterium]